MNQYKVLVTGSADAELILSYKASVLYKVEFIRTKVSDEQWNKLIFLCPKKEADLYSHGFPNVDIMPVIKQRSMFSRYIDLYDEFYYKKTGIKARMSAIEGASVKKIIAHLESIEKDSESALALFDQVLKSWDKIDEFYRKQMELRQINHNLNTILRLLKNGDSTSAKGHYANDLRASL